MVKQPYIMPLSVGNDDTDIVVDLTDLSKVPAENMATLLNTFAIIQRDNEYYRKVKQDTYWIYYTHTDIGGAGLSQNYADVILINRNAEVPASYRSITTSSSKLITPENLASNLEGDDFITVDNNEQGTKVQVSIDANYKPHIVELSGISGTLSDTNFAKLTTSELAQIINNDEYYKKADEQSGFILFVHNGRDNQQQIYTKCIYVYTDTEAPLTYKTWALVSTEMTPKSFVTTQTTAPSSAITDGGIHFVILSSEPATRYNGYIYFITEA